MYFKIAPQRDIVVNVSALLRAGHKVSGVANLVGVSLTSAYAIKKTHGQWRRCQQTCRQGLKNLCIVTACRRSFEAVLHICWRLSIVNALLYWVDCLRDTPRRFATSLIFVPHKEVQKRLLYCFCRAILKYTTITNLFLRYHSHRASGGLNKSQIITAKLPEL